MEPICGVEDPLAFFVQLSASCEDADARVGGGDGIGPRDAEAGVGMDGKEKRIDCSDGFYEGVEGVGEDGGAVVDLEEVEEGVNRGE